MDKSKEKESRQQKNTEKMKSENREATRKNQKSKGADANANDNVWFATIFLCSLEIERQLHWWRYSALNKGFEIPICWFLLLLTSFANLSALLPSTDDFPREYYTDLRQFFFALVALLNSLAAIGLWIELHWLLAPILIVYFLFWTLAFAYLLCLMPFLVYSDETLPICNLLALLLPLNVLAGKSLLEAFFLLRSKRQWQAKGERLKLGLKDNSNKRKVRQEKTGVPEKLWFDQLGQHHGAAVAENSTIARTIELVDDWIGRNGCKKEKNIHPKDEEDNLSHFYGQIAEREICIGSRKLNGMEGGPESVVIKSKNGEKVAAEGQIVHLANGEVRRRRRMLKKKRKRGMPMMANPKTLMFPAIVEKESSASTTSTTAAEGQWDEEEIQHHHQYSNNNRGRNMANQGREPLTTMNVPLLMGRGENKKKKPPIPRPRCFRQNFGPASAVGLYPMGSPLSPPSSNSTFLASSSPMPMPLTISRMNSPNRGYQETEV